MGVEKKKKDYKYFHLTFFNVTLLEKNSISTLLFNDIFFPSLIIFLSILATLNPLFKIFL